MVFELFEPSVPVMAWGYRKSASADPRASVTYPSSNKLHFKSLEEIEMRFDEILRQLSQNEISVKSFIRHQEELIYTMNRLNVNECPENIYEYYKKIKQKIEKNYV